LELYAAIGLTELKKATAYIDGSGNSERIQACAVVLQYDGEEHRRTQLLPPNTTNNVGEYSGLLLAIRTARELGVEVLRIHSDSKLVVEQVNGRWQCKDDHLRQLRDEAWKTSRQFRSISIGWIPREQNTEADALCRAVIEAAVKAPANPFFKAKPVASYPRAYSFLLGILCPDPGSSHGPIP
jgi:ribonuclease HI